MTGPLLKRLFTVEEYRQMGAAGVLKEGERVELLEGEIVQMSPIGRRHGGTVKALNRFLGMALGDRAIVSIQDPVELDAHTEPQPDAAVLKPRDDFYRSAHPKPEDVLLVIEVMDTSHEVDRGKKLLLYAEKGVSEVWLVDLPGEAIEVYRSPKGTRYTEEKRLVRGDRISPGAFPDVEFEVGQILG